MWRKVGTWKSSPENVLSIWTATWQWLAWLSPEQVTQDMAGPYKRCIHGLYPGGWDSAAAMTAVDQWSIETYLFGCHSAEDGVCVCGLERKSNKKIVPTPRQVLPSTPNFPPAFRAKVPEPNIGPFLQARLSTYPWLLIHLFSHQSQKVPLTIFGKVLTFTNQFSTSCSYFLERAASENPKNHITRSMHSRSSWNSTSS